MNPEEIELSIRCTQYPMHFAAPIFFGTPRSPGSKINNGTATLIQFRDMQLAVTNQHVIYEYTKRRRSEKNIVLYIGNFEIANIYDVLTYEDHDADLCVICLKQASVEQLQSGDEVPTQFYDIDDLYGAPLKEGSVVAFGGYPGVFREEESQNHLVFGTASSGASQVCIVTNRNILFDGMKGGSIVFNHNNFTPIDFGGMSGGPVFLRDNSTPMAPKFRLVGIIYQYTSATDTFYARPLSLLGGACFAKGAGVA